MSKKQRKKRSKRRAAATAAIATAALSPGAAEAQREPSPQECRNQVSGAFEDLEPFEAEVGGIAGALGLNPSSTVGKVPITDRVLREVGKVPITDAVAREVGKVPITIAVARDVGKVPLIRAADRVAEDICEAPPEGDAGRNPRGR